jgi:hypothetical protein
MAHIDQKINPTGPIDPITINAPVSAISVSVGIIPIEQDINMFKDTYDIDYEDAINVSSLEVSHSHVIHQKQLDIQLEKEKRKRLIS